METEKISKQREKLNQSIIDKFLFDNTNYTPEFERNRQKQKISSIPDPTDYIKMELFKINERVEKMNDEESALCWSFYKFGFNAVRYGDNPLRYISNEELRGYIEHYVLGLRDAYVKALLLQEMKKRVSNANQHYVEASDDDKELSLKLEKANAKMYFLERIGVFDYLNEGYEQTKCLDDSKLARVFGAIIGAHEKKEISNLRHLVGFFRSSGRNGVDPISTRTQESVKDMFDELGMKFPPFKRTK